MVQPHVCAHLFHARIGGVVVQYIDLPEAGYGGIDDRLNAAFFGKIRVQGECSTAGRVDLLGHTLGADDVDIRQHDQSACFRQRPHACRSEEHTSELQSLMRISYAVFCLKKKKTQTQMINTQKNLTTTLID